MSSEGMGVMREENDEKSALVPRLRFPEFNGAWTLSPMSGLYSFKGNNPLSRDKLNYEAGSFRNIHYGDIHKKFALHFRADAEPVPYINDGESHSTIRPENYCMAGDMVFADASEDMADIGKAIEIIDAGDVPLVSGLHTILARPNEGSFALGFGAYLFSSEGVRKQIQREGQGAKVLGLSATRLGNVKLHYPNQPDEQQKIADCLSSLDDLITAETKKLNALKTHKKGLMQQLFPREGETVPRLRFTEFQKLGPWKSKTLSGIATIRAGTTPLRAEPAFYSGGLIPWVKTTDLNNGFIDRTEECITPAAKARINPVGSVLVAMYGGFNQIGRTGYLKVPAATNQAISVLSADENEVLPVYLLAWMNARVEDWKKVASSSRKDPNITGTDVANFPIAYPSKEEQRKIADDLATLDDLITNQNLAVNALKTHKKGLMQQLFPVRDEVSA